MKPNPSIPESTSKLSIILNKQESRHLVVDWYQPNQQQIIFDAAFNYGDVEYIKFSSAGRGHVSFREETIAKDAFSDFKRRFDADFYKHLWTGRTDTVQLLHVPDAVPDDQIHSLLSKYGKIVSLSRQPAFGTVEISFEDGESADKVVLETHDTVLFPEFGVHIISTLVKSSNYYSRRYSNYTNAKYLKPRKSYYTNSTHQ